MRHEVQVTYAEALLRKTTLQFVNRWIGWKFYVALVFLVTALIYLCSTGDRSWFIPVLGTILVLAVLVVIRMYTFYLKSSMSVFKQMLNKTVTFVFDDVGMSVKSEAGSGSLKWELLPRLWQFPDAWLLFTSKNTYSTFPIADVPDEVKDFIVSKMKETGGKIS